MNWFEAVMPEFCPAAKRLAGRRRLVYVEIGVFYGHAAKWVMANVATHRHSHGYGIDPYPIDQKRDQAAIDDVKTAAVAALKPWEDAWRWTWIFQDSKVALRDWRGPKIDLLYIDGSHYAPDVLQDFVLAWPHLRVGSVVIFDDQGIGKRKWHRHVPEAIEAVRMAFGDLIGVVNDGLSQFALEVRYKHPSELPYPAPRRRSGRSA